MIKDLFQIVMLKKFFQLKKSCSKYVIIGIIIPISVEIPQWNASSCTIVEIMLLIKMFLATTKLSDFHRFISTIVIKLRFK